MVFGKKKQVYKKVSPTTQSPQSLSPEEESSQAVENLDQSEQPTEDVDSDDSRSEERPSMPDMPHAQTPEEILVRKQEELKKLKEEVVGMEKSIEEKEQNQEKVHVKFRAVPAEDMFNSISDRLENLEIAMKEIVNYLRDK